MSDKPIRIRLTRRVRSEVPVGPQAQAEQGIYEAEINPLGAISVRASGGEMLGIKPGEFEFASVDDVLEYERRFPGWAGKVAGIGVLCAEVERLRHDMERLGNEAAELSEANLWLKARISYLENDITGQAMREIFNKYLPDRAKLVKELREMASYPCNEIKATTCRRFDEIRADHEMKSIGIVPCFPCWAARVLREIGVWK